MKLEVGKKYVLASGQVVGPLWCEEDEKGNIYMSGDAVGGFHPMWTEDGKADFFTRKEHNFPQHDIVKEFDESF